MSLKNSIRDGENESWWIWEDCVKAFNFLQDNGLWRFAPTLARWLLEINALSKSDKVEFEVAILSSDQPGLVYLFVCVGVFDAHEVKEYTR